METRVVQLPTDFCFVLFQHMDKNTAYLHRKISCFAYEVMGICFVRSYNTSKAYTDRIGIYADISEGPDSVTDNSIRRAFLATEEGFINLVSQLWNTQPDIATCGTCCLVGVIQKNTMHIANAGDSRAVLGRKIGHKVEAVQLSTEHNANLEEVRREMKARHPDDSQIVEFKHGVWRIKGIIQVDYLHPI